MAPPISRPKSRHPELQITFPRNISHAFAGQKRPFTLTVEDFQLSWLDYIKKQDPALCREVAKQNRFTIMDIRGTSTRRIWNLNSTVKQFIDSFGRTLQAYKAVIGTQRPNTNPPPAQVASSASMSNGSAPNTNRSAMNYGVTARAPNSNSPSTKRGPILLQELSKNKPPCYSPSNTRSSSRNKPGGSPKAGPPPSSPLKRKSNGVAPPVGPQNTPKRAHMSSGEIRLQMSSSSASAGPSNGTKTQTQGISKTPFNLPFLELDLDDSASMAPTVDSQDSQDDLIEAGVKIEEVKTDILNRLNRHFDNSMMLRMRLELQGLMKTQKYFSATKRMPLISNMLQCIFRLNGDN